MTAKSSWTTYDRGQAASLRGVLYSSNPYKYPASALSWSMGWLDFKRQKIEVKKKYPEMWKKRIAHLRKVK